MSQPVITSPVEQLLSVVRQLPPDQQVQVAEFAVFLAQRTASKREEDWFWDHIHLIDWGQPTVEGALRPLVNQLTSLDTQEIFLFHDVLSDKLSALDAPRFHEHSAGSADLFLYA